jgi:hypothetical protein
MVFLFPASVMSHSGGLNSSGCHAGSKPYHCHRSASEMTKSSSGGNRLKCSAGSTSKDCRNNNVTSHTASSNSGAINTEGDTVVSEVSSNANVVDADGEAITILGFNYDQSVEEAITNFTLRFECSEYFVQRYDKCTGDPSLLSWSKDAVGEIKSIVFRCEAFGGCTYLAGEIFDALNAKFKLSNEISGDFSICGTGIVGERICVSKGAKSITLYKAKFRQKPMNFD